MAVNVIDVKKRFIVFGLWFDSAKFHQQTCKNNELVVNWIKRGVKWILISKLAN